MPRQTKADLEALLESERERADYAEHQLELQKDKAHELTASVADLEKKLQAEQQRRISEGKDYDAKKHNFANSVAKVAQHLREVANVGVFKREGPNSYKVVASAVILGDFCADYEKINYCGIFGHPWQSYNWCRTAVADRGGPSSSYEVVTLTEDGMVHVERYFDDTGAPKGKRLKFRD